MAGKEVTQYEAAGLDEKMRYVQTLTSAGSLIPKGLHDAGKPSPGKVLLVLETGAMLGIHPMAAMGGIHIIEGKATISPGLMSGLVRKNVTWKPSSSPLAVRSQPVTYHHSVRNASWLPWSRGNSRPEPGSTSA